MQSRRTFLKTALASSALGTLSARALHAATHQLPASSAAAVTERAPESVTQAILALNRLAFGPRPEDIEKFHSLERYSEEQLHPERIEDAFCEKKIAEANLGTLSKPLKQLWHDHWLVAEQMKDELKDAPSHAPSGGFNGGDGKLPVINDKKDENQLRHAPVQETIQATWLKAVYSQRQLQELMADFWHNHFNVFGFDNHIAPVFVHYDRDVVRRHLFGNFREMLEAVAKSPAMLFYLDNFLNQSGNPNENYARELFELHTLGAENYLGTRDREKVQGFSQGKPVGYVDGDVYEAARCFTGWRIEQGKNTAETGEFNYFEQWHDRFQKVVLGTRIREYNSPMKDAETVLDLVAFHRGTSRFIARKLCRRFVADAPPEKLVSRIAAVFYEKRKAPDQIRATMRALLHSPEFQTSYGLKMKRPFEAIVSMLRATGADFSPTDPFLNNYKRAGQELFGWRSPDGYPDVHYRWGGTTPMLERWRMANMIAHGRPDGIDFDVRKATPDSVRGAENLARFWTERLLGRAASKNTFEAVRAFLAEGNPPRERLPEAVALVLMSPEFQTR